MKNAYLSNRKRCLAVLIIILVIIGFGTKESMAHRLRIFASVEGAQIVGETAFSGGGLPKNIEVKIFPADEESPLFSINTDLYGKFSFPVSRLEDAKGGDVLFVVNTGDGHRGEWLVTGEEYSQIKQPTSNKKKQSIMNEKMPVKNLLIGLGAIFGLALGVNIIKKKRSKK